MEKTVFADLQAVLKLKRKDGEAAEAFAERLARKANDIEDDDWQTLDEATQLWVNGAIEALKGGAGVTPPPGLEEVAKASEGSPPEKKTPVKKKISAAAKPKKTDGGRGPKGKFAVTDKIVLKVEANPFREGSKCHGWFGKIEDGMTVQEAVAAGAPRHHLRWAHTLGHIDIGG